MNALRASFILFAALAAALLFGGRGNASFIQTQRDQISVYVLVNVTPAPIAYDNAADADRGIDVRMGLRARGSSNSVDALPAQMVAQSTAQHGVRVQAEVSPNPNATLLYSNTPAVTLSAVAGTTVTSPPCAYTVTVHTLATTSWTLDDGLSNDFSGAAFPGKDLANNTYPQLGAPLATATPFIVYPNNNNAWYAREKSSGVQTYCVTLTLTVPSTVPGGAYSTNAVYTLYY